MISRHKSVSQKKSMTLIEVLIDAAILSMVSVIIITSLLSSLRTTTKTSEIATAGQLVNEKMETLRNLSYNSLATKFGAIFPQGDILDDETLIVSGKKLNVHTSINYVDDPYDGVAPTDLNPADYKKITINVSSAATGKKLTYLSSNIASRAAETDSDTGVLRISVLDASGSPVQNASVNVTNTIATPDILINTSTDTNGLVLIPNLPILGGYHVIATKNGFSTDSTYSGSSNPTPINPDATILLQQVTPVTLSIDLTSTIIATTSGLSGGAPIANLIGQKLIGTSPDTVKTTLPQVLSPTTTINNVEFDSYKFSPSTGWYIRSCDPMRPFPVNPATTVAVNCDLTQDSTDILIKTITPRTVTAIPGVTLSILGSNFAYAQVSLQKGADPEIPLSGLVPGDGDTTLNGDVDFSAVPIGTYSVVIRNIYSKTTIQTNGITIQ